MTETVSGRFGAKSTLLNPPLLRKGGRKKKAAEAAFFNP